MDNLYYESASVIRQALNKENSVRSGVYSSAFKNKKQLLRICCETLKHREFLDGIIKSSSVRRLLKDPIIGDFPLLYVLLYEFLFGNGLMKASKKLSAPIFAAKKAIHEQRKKLQDAGVLTDVSTRASNSFLKIPRYARVNTLKWTLDEAVQVLRGEKWTVKEMSGGDSDDKFFKYAKDMQWDEVYLDPHVENLLIFHSKTDLHRHWMVTEGFILLQDKASCMPAFLLKPKIGSQILDACAAPGMKTTHLSALVTNRGKIWAVDKAADRVETMRTIIEKAGATNVNVVCSDFLQIDISDKKFAKVRYALVDPPCSGSGIVKRVDICADNASEVEPKRLRSLSNLQAMMLKHAMKLPNLRKIVYSTCSIYEQENEEVIKEVLSDEEVRGSFELIAALPSWSCRGSSKYDFGNLCIRAFPDVNLTNGFFIAVFRRMKNE